VGAKFFEAIREHDAECTSEDFFPLPARHECPLDAPKRRDDLVDTPLQPADVLAVIYHQLAIPLDTAFPDFTGRPIAVNDGGQMIRQVLDERVLRPPCSVSPAASNITGT
jgi:hypothetical protein